MRELPTTEVSSTEWRWLIIVSGLLVTVTLLPYLWAFASDSPTDGWQFMGMLHNHTDGATYLSKIQEGVRGSWLFTLQYTSEPHMGAAINEFYLALGHVARLLNIPVLLAFHLARLATAFFMYTAIYVLGSTFFGLLRARRLFFSILAFGSGLSWLFILFSPAAVALPTDLTVPESIPFYATLVNPHFPLTIGVLCLLTAIFVRVFRPGYQDTPMLENGGLSVIILTAVLAVVQPQGWLAFAVGLAVYVGIHVLRLRRLPMKELLWSALVWLAAAPFLVYYLAVTSQNDAMAIWNRQNVTPSPLPFYYVLGFGVPLFLAIPAMWRAVRRFEQDGDRFMLIWFIVNCILLYLPFNLQRRLAIGMIIPIGYFCVRSLMDFWLPQVRRRRHRLVLVLLFVAIIPSNVFALFIPLFGIANPKRGLDEAILLPEDTNNAIYWLQVRGVSGSVVLAAPETTSLWIPAYSDLRVVYGHPFETLSAERKLSEVQTWAQSSDLAVCRDLLTRYTVRYLITESVFQAEGCIRALKLGSPVQRFGDVAIYELFDLVVLR